MYPESPMDIYKAERIVELVTTDCAFYQSPSSLWECETKEEKEAWCVKRNEEVLPKALDLINKNIKANFKANGFAATDSFSIADVAVLTYLHTIVLNNNRKAYGTKLLKKRKPLNKYWKKHRKRLTEYIAYDRADYLL